MSAPAAPAAPASRDRLMRRIHDSLARHATFATCRARDGLWLPLAPGVRAKTLHAGGGIHARLFAFDPGAALPPIGPMAAEWLLLGGELHADGNGAWRAGDWRLGRQDFALRTPVGALLFARACLAEPAAGLPPAEAAWWPPAGAAAQECRAAEGPWLPFAPGIALRPFRAEGDVMSMLARFEPDARIPAHRHGLDEHCVMLEGDLFLGDVLLRRHDYQLAPAGSEHGELHSDVGCLLYFHGAVDPALRGDDTAR